MDPNIKYGTEIQLISNPVIKGKIRKACIGGKNWDEIEYMITFWVGSERKEKWVCSDEIELVPVKQPVGFKPSNNNNQTLLKS